MNNNVHHQYFRLHFRNGTTKIVDRAEYLRLNGLKRRMFMTSEPCKIHQCSVCHKTGPWDDGWGWYGCYADIENGKPIIKTCSEKCFGQGERDGLIPADAMDD